MNPSLKNLLSLIIFLLLFQHVKAQDSKKKQWDISIGYGLAIPVGGFQKVAQDNYFEYGSGAALSTGFDKKNNSAARLGYVISLVARYAISNKFDVTLDIGHAINSVNVESINNSWNATFAPNQFETVQKDYATKYVLPGIGYTVKWSNWELNFSQQIGIAILAFPEYHIDFLSFPRPSSFKNELPESDIQSLMLGWKIQGSYKIRSRFLAGVDLTYSTADFNYKVHSLIEPCN